MTKNKKNFFALATVILSLFLLPAFSHAVAPSAKSQIQSVDSQINQVKASPEENNSLVTCNGGDCSLCDLLKTGARIFDWLLSIASVVAVLFIVINGFLYFYPAYDLDSMSWAKEGLKYALAGFAICIFSWLGIHISYLVFGFKGSWWQMECAETTGESSEDKKVLESELYKNEITINNQGGRNNPLALPDLTAAGIKNLPENKYFFIHGLGGQPLDSAAKQLTTITAEAKKQGKIVYVVTPKRDPVSYEIIGSQSINLTSQAGSNLRQTQNNIKKLIAGIIAESPSGTNFPFFIAESAESLTEFNNVWPDSVAPDQSLKTYRNGVVYEEGKSLKRGEEETLFSVNLVSANPKDKKNEKFYLNRDNPITFKIPQDISPTAAKQMAVDIAQVVAEATKNSESLNKDQWNQLVGLMTKDYISKKTNSNTNSNDEGDNVYSPGAFATYAVKNPGQTTDPNKLKAAENELDKIAKDIIDNELNQNINSNSNKNNNKTGQSGLRDALSDAAGVLGTIEDYFFYQFSNTPTLDNWMAGEKKLPENNNGQPSGVNVSRVPNLDPTKLSKIGGRITTDNALSLKQREAIKDLVVDIQKEMEDNSGIVFNIPPELIMCIFEKESKFDPGAMSQTGCSGLGQMSMGATRSATRKLKKLAPRHFMAFSEKIRNDFGVDLEETLTREGGNEKKREILRSDPNLNAVLSFVHLTEKGIVGRGGSARNSQDLRSMVIGYGPGNTVYATSIMYCLQTNSWRNIPEKIQAIIEAREIKNK